MQTPYTKKRAALSVLFAMKYARLPLSFLKFWFFESPLNILQFFFSLNSAFMHFFSLPLFIQTYFKPLKNEYRQGLVGFSRAVGIFIKTFLIAADIIMLTILLSAETIIFVGYIFFPIATVWLFFV